MHDDLSEAFVGLKLTNYIMLGTLVTAIIAVVGKLKYKTLKKESDAVEFEHFKIC